MVIVILVVGLNAKEMVAVALVLLLSSHASNVELTGVEVHFILELNYVINTFNLRKLSLT